MTVSAWLRERGAHHDLVGWAEPFGDDWARLWRECPRGDWLLGIAARAGVDRAALVRAACACAREGLTYLPEDEGRPAAAIEAGERWARGEADDEAVHAAADEAEACAEGAPHPAVAAAALAASAAARSVTRPEDAPAAAAAAAEAAVHDAGDCAMMQALRYVQATCADHVRAHVAVDAVARAGR